MKKFNFNKEIENMTDKVDEMGKEMKEYSDSVDINKMTPEELLQHFEKMNEFMDRNTELLRETSKIYEKKELEELQKKIKNINEKSGTNDTIS